MHSTMDELFFLIVVGNWHELFSQLTKCFVSLKNMSFPTDNPKVTVG